MPEQRLELLQLVDVQLGELLDPLLAERRQPQPHDARVVIVTVALDETAGLRAVDELDGAVMPEQQVRRQLADRRAAVVVVTLDREQQLVLRMGQTDGSRLGLAPAVEASQRRAERQQRRIVELRSPRHLPTLANIGLYWPASPCGLPGMAPSDPDCPISPGSGP